MPIMPGSATCLNWYHYCQLLLLLLLLNTPSESRLPREPASSLYSECVPLMPGELDASLGTPRMFEIVFSILPDDRNHGLTLSQLGPARPRESWVWEFWVIEDDTAIRKGSKSASTRPPSSQLTSGPRTPTYDLKRSACLFGIP